MSRHAESMLYTSLTGVDRKSRVRPFRALFMSLGVGTCLGASPEPSCRWGVLESGGHMLVGRADGSQAKERLVERGTAEGVWGVEDGFEESGHGYILPPGS